MRIDLMETGNKEIDVYLNGSKLEAVIWADDVTGECEVFEQHWSTKEYIPDADGPLGRRSLKLKGEVRIDDRRKPQLSPDRSQEDHLRYGCCGMCIILVTPPRFAADNGMIEVADMTGRPISGFAGKMTLTQLASEAVRVANLYQGRISHIEVDTSALGDVVLEEIKNLTSIPAYPK